LREDAETIYFGGLLAGTGTAWFDDLQLTIDGKPLLQARTKSSIAANSYPAAKDTVFQRHSNLSLPAKLSQQEIENLAVLGRVWGFVKYYHPAVAAGNFNMDAELFRVLPSVLAAPNENTRSQLLSAWVTKFGSVPACKKCQEPPAEKVRLQPDLAWLTDKSQLSEALRTQLAYLRQNRNQAEHYYVGAAPAGNAAFQHEAAYSNALTPDAGLRLLALYRYWNMVAYYFPYRYAIGEDWQQVLPEFIPKLASAGTAEQYRLTLLALIARIHDTHANIYQDQVLNDYYGALYAPARIRFVENQAVVTDYYNEELGKASGLQKGDIIEQIDGAPVSAVVKRLQPFAPASNEPTQLRNIASYLLLRGRREQLSLLVRRDGQELSLTVTRYPTNKLNFLLIESGTPDPEANPWKLLPGNIGYLALGTTKVDKLPEIMQAAESTKGLIIDIRNYPATDVMYALSSYLLDKSAAFVQFSRPEVTYPGLFSVDSPLYVRPGKGKPYRGKVIILVNEITQSSAEFTTMALRATPNATVIGSTTAGADGNVSQIVLPGNIPTMITGLGIYYPDGRETQRIGIVPDIEVKPTIQGIKAGRDEVLERAVQLIETAG
ncbi:MAG TPA: S41 family peptidase, partial [Hymenobacter sp.]